MLKRATEAMSGNLAASELVITSGTSPLACAIIEQFYGRHIVPYGACGENAAVAYYLRLLLVPHRTVGAEEDGQHGHQDDAAVGQRRALRRGWVARFGLRGGRLFGGRIHQRFGDVELRERFGDGVKDASDERLGHRGVFFFIAIDLKCGQCWKGGCAVIEMMR